MGRWEPDAAGRLRAAATELFVDPGYDVVTVAQIADRAGLTARTFFRHFADKREVLFAGSEWLEEVVADAVASAPSGPPIDEAAYVVGRVAEALGDRRDFSRTRQRVIEAHEELRERELVKLARMTDVLVDGLEQRGLDPTSARLAGETGIAVFRVAFERWTAEDTPADLSLPAACDEAFARLRALSTG